MRASTAPICTVSPAFTSSSVSVPVEVNPSVRLACAWTVPSADTVVVTVVRVTLLVAAVFFGALADPPKATYATTTTATTTAVPPTTHQTRRRPRLMVGQCGASGSLFPRPHLGDSSKPLL